MRHPQALHAVFTLCVRTLREIKKKGVETSIEEPFLFVLMLLPFLSRATGRSRCKGIVPERRARNARTLFTPTFKYQSTPKCYASLTRLLKMPFRQRQECLFFHHRPPGLSLGAEMPIQRVSLPLATVRIHIMTSRRPHPLPLHLHRPNSPSHL
jgi:hypothetical protein